MTNDVIKTPCVGSITSSTVTDNFTHLILSNCDQIGSSKDSISLYIIPSAQGLNSYQRLLDPAQFHKPVPAVQGGGGYLCHTVSRTTKPPPPTVVAMGTNAASHITSSGSHSFLFLEVPPPHSWTLGKWSMSALKLIEMTRVCVTTPLLMHFTCRVTGEILIVPLPYAAFSQTSTGHRMVNFKPSSRFNVGYIWVPLFLC